MRLNEEISRMKQMMGLKEQVSDSEVDEQIGQIIQKGGSLVKKLIDGSKNTKTISKTLPKNVRKFKNPDEAILFYEKIKKKFEGDWNDLIKKLRAKEINGEQFTNGLNILKKQYGIDDVNYFSNQISKLREMKKVTNLKSIIGNVSQDKILTSPKQLGKNISVGGSNNLGVFDLGNGYVAKKSKYGFKDDSIEMLKFKDKIKSPRISKTVQVKNIPDDSGVESIYIVQQKADGKPMSEMSIEEIKKIPDIHKKNFEKDLVELKNIGVTVDPSKMNNFIYNPNKGIQLIDLNVGNYLSQPGRIQHTINHVLKIK